MMLASDGLKNGDMDAVQRLLKAHEPGTCVEDLRGFEWRYIRQAADQSGLVTHQLQGLQAKQACFIPYGQTSRTGPTASSYDGM